MNRQILSEKSIKESPFGVTAYEYKGFDFHTVIVRYNRDSDKGRGEKYVLCYWKNEKVLLTRKVSSLTKVRQFINVVDGFAF